MRSMAYWFYDGVLGSVLCVFVFFKQKTAYEMLRSLVGSEMCIRDRYGEGTAAFTGEDVAGFTRIYSLPVKIYQSLVHEHKD